MNKESDAKIILRASFAPGAPSEEEYSEHGLKDDFDIYGVLDSATLHPNIQIIQVCQTMHDYHIQYKYSQYRHDDQLYQKDKKRRADWRRKFADNLDARLETFKNIHANLTITSIENGISPLRRLEIRFLPLDPAFVGHLFRALQNNLTLQELILTDESLQFCKGKARGHAGGEAVFQELFTAIQTN